jgi:hypothetical protein
LFLLLLLLLHFILQFLMNELLYVKKFTNFLVRLNAIHRHLQRVYVVCRRGKDFVQVMVNKVERACMTRKFQSLASGIQIYEAQAEQLSAERKRSSEGAKADADEAEVEGDDAESFEGGEVSEPL